MPKFELLEARQRLSKTLEDYLTECNINTGSSASYECEFNAIIDFASAYLLGTILSIENINSEQLLEFFSSRVRKNLTNALNSYQTNTIH
jgi:uncharacterized protein (DUF2164 family)